MEHRKLPGSDLGAGGSYPEGGGGGAVGGGLVDRSASIALTKLMSTKRAGGDGSLLSSGSSSSISLQKSKNLMFNHKHLQYIPLHHQDRQHRQRSGVAPPSSHQQPPPSHMTSLMVNGRTTAGHPSRSLDLQGHPSSGSAGINYHRQDPQLMSPAHQSSAHQSQAHHQYSSTDRDRQHLRYPPQSHSQHTRIHPVTKSIGVGANLNYPRTAPPGSRQGQGLAQEEEQSRDFRIVPSSYQQHHGGHGLTPSRYDSNPQPHPSPASSSTTSTVAQLAHGGVLNISLGHGLGHSADSLSVHHQPSRTTVELGSTSHKELQHGSSQGRRSPLTQQHLHQHHRLSSPPPLPQGGLIKPKFSAGPHPSTLSSAQLEMFNSLKAASQKIVSQNVNGTLSVTVMPSNDSELQLFRVLQRANLLNYFDVMIELGGDDVQQLCDAGEEEFLEIMALIGMASKPLHVRRLQKSLQEFLTHPNLFPNPILGPPLSAFTQGSTNSDTTTSATSTTTVSTSSKTQLPIRPIPFHSGGATSNHFASSIAPSTETSRPYNPKFHALRTEQPGSAVCPTVSSAIALGARERSDSPSKPTSVPAGRTTPNQTGTPTPVQPLSEPNSNNSLHSPASSTSSNSNSGFSGAPFTLPNGISVRFPSEQLLESRLRDGKTGDDSRPQSRQSGNGSENPDSRNSLSPVPFLQESEIDKIRESAIRLIQTLPEEFLEPKVTAKRKAASDFETVIRIPDEDPKRVEEIRKYATIYARYNCKRKAQKPLTIHELSTNEAASQLCLRLPALLTRREDLKLLSREVVRNAGLPYSSIISATSFRDFGLNGRTTPLDTGGNDLSRPRSAPSTHSNPNVPEDMSQAKNSHRPESSPASTESKTPSDLTMIHGPRKRATTALALVTSPKERKLDDDLSRNFQPKNNCSSIKYEDDNS